MGRDQTGQEGALVEVRMKIEHLEAEHQTRGSPADHRSCFKCAFFLASVMGLVNLVLVGGFFLHFFLSHSQDTQTYGQGRYDFFEVEKPATYLIYVWLRFSDVTEDEVTLIHKLDNDDRTLQKKKISEREVFFLEKAILTAGSLSINIRSNYTNCSFLVCKLLT
ncbi:hypothetical protein KUDE01_015931 [Dissostichus eleginoides]|uniref:Uncharacterized protein n=1 Tax=Dissostichus eleginoides TaxID=100907 RepID=A0AAD9C8T0_DISEL|nr:hypothetical protein KUDE01_015931 [Dissostichus eleginoides]